MKFHVAMGNVHWMDAASTEPQAASFQQQNEAINQLLAEWLLIWWHWKWTLFMCWKNLNTNLQFHTSISANFRQDIALVLGDFFKWIIPLGRTMFIEWWCAITLDREKVVFLLFLCLFSFGLLFINSVISLISLHFWF